ncbi:MAG: bifunctional phosphopantothenoylcysteine decarboxylase/phosphopantothenate--cysteine ligase CoaBC [Thaumarchaeota archaeon]|nr:bifunctional phosphopantothenoylcysteine decarboxylase/phosphopantothenate--cysteine ligase CoaBC [Nitrososphaerota archaeon]
MSKRDPLKEIQFTRGRELDGKRIVLGVTGSVASVETPQLARDLIRHGADVVAVMTPSAEKLIRADLLEWATGNPVIRELTGKTEHVRLIGESPEQADLLLVAPCTANTISKIALGIDDTPVTTFASMAIGNGVPVLVCPAAHEPMYRNRAVAENIRRLKEMGVEVVEPRIEEGKAKIADRETIVMAVLRLLEKRDLEGRNILVSGGPSAEFIDPVRVITNLSSGKTGVDIATEAWRRGASVSYVYGGSLAPPALIRSRRIVTTEEMSEAVLSELSSRRFDVFISAAAPADFTPLKSAASKISTKLGNISLELKPTRKIVREVRSGWPELFVVAFKAETVRSLKELERIAKAYLVDSKADMVVANSVSGGAAFGSDYNELLVVTKRKTIHFARDLKTNLARRLLDEIAKEIGSKRKYAVKSSSKAG